MNKKLFDTIREPLFRGRITQDQVDGINFLVKACREKNFRPSWIAYVLATAYHETAKTMQPIKEFGGHDYFMRMYDVSGRNPERARRMGNTNIGDGPRYCGRGYVQLTWKVNYDKAGKILGVDLVRNPELAMDHDIAAKITVAGMEQGWFTGKKLADYITVGTPMEFKNARKIINGTDKDVQIANYATVFLNGLV